MTKSGDPKRCHRHINLNHLPTVCFTLLVSGVHGATYRYEFQARARAVVGTSNLKRTLVASDRVQKSAFSSAKTATTFIVTAAIIAAQVAVCVAK